MMQLMFSHIQVNDQIVNDPKFQYMFSVEEVNKLVNAGMPFRDAYKKVGLDIEAGKFNYDLNVDHTHEGSIGNLCTAEIKNLMKKIIGSFPFQTVSTAITKLVG